MAMQRRIFILLIVFFVLQCYFYYSQLPDPLATNFDAAGEANGWSSKSAFIAVYILMVAIFAATFLLLPRYVCRIPTAYVSMPNKEYWLAPERREDTFAFLSYQMLVIGNATMVFLICIIQLVIEANVSGTYRLAPGLMWILLGGYLLFTSVWTIRLIARFSKTG
jgi:uncharacterized membrane protein